MNWMTVLIFSSVKKALQWIELNAKKSAYIIKQQNALHALFVDISDAVGMQQNARG